MRRWAPSLLREMARRRARSTRLCTCRILPVSGLAAIFCGLQHMILPGLINFFQDALQDL
jgi:hypothetical protein